MPIPDYTAKDMVLFSTIIKTSARLHDWANALPVVAGVDGIQTVQEVQCMRLNGALYIAGNHTDCNAIYSFLGAFGVTDHDSLLKCLSYSHWLLTMTRAEKGDFARTYNDSFDGQDNEAYMYSRQSAALLPAIDKVDAKKLVNRTDWSDLSEAEKRLSWFLKKFTGMKKMLNFERPADSKIRRNANYLGDVDLVLVNDTQDIHAELKLMRLLTEAALLAKIPRSKSQISLGGSKAACKFCAPWISCFQFWVKPQFGMTIELPAGDPRASGGGSGCRPDLTAEKKKPFSYLVNALFNGNANNVGTDITALKARVEADDPEKGYNEC